MAYAAWIGLAYLLGSVPFGLVVARLFCGVDPRRAGSGNIGATNVARLCGFPYGLLTLLLDVGKGFGPVLAARLVVGSWPFVSLVLLAALAGHMRTPGSLPFCSFRPVWTRMPPVKIVIKLIEKKAIRENRRRPFLALARGHCVIH